MAGVNDLRAEDLFIKAVIELQKLYLQILEDLPNVELYLASLTPVDTEGSWFDSRQGEKFLLSEEKIGFFNDMLEYSINGNVSLIRDALRFLDTKDQEIIIMLEEFFHNAEKSQGIDRLTFVDMNSKLSIEDLQPLNPGGINQADGLHPNKNGYKKIASEWSEQIVSSPEPGSILGLLVFGTVGAASTLKRKLKPSKEKELEQVS